MRPMPVLSAFLSGKKVVTPVNGFGNPVQEMPQDVRREMTQVLASKSVNYDVQTAAELFWTSKNDTFNINELSGSLRAPSPFMWMEWVIPDQIMFNGKQQSSVDAAQSELVDQMTKMYGNDAPIYIDKAKKEVNICRQALMLEEQPLHVNGSYQITVTLLNLYDDVIVHFPIMRRVRVNSDGVPGDIQDIVPTSMPTRQVQALRGEMGDYNVAWMALALINCKNIRTQDVGRVEYKKTTSQKRRRLPDIRFNTIVLPGMTGSHEGSQTGDDRRDLALHRVRGHFKTFTADKPLLGQHVGTYWWGWQVRGKADNGVNINDYEVRL